MTELFGEVAARLCNAASLLLGWRPDEFWNATPAELSLAVQAPAVAAEGCGLAMFDALRRRFPDE